MDSLVVPLELWGGGYYELHIALGSRSDERMRAALEALWAQPTIDGPFVDERRAPVDDLDGDYYGVATLHDGEVVPCRSYCWPDYTGPGDERLDTLFLILPANGLRAVWPQFAEFPFVEPDGVRSWQEPLEDWLADIGRGVFGNVAFPFARIGFEVSTIDPDAWMLTPNERPPDDRGIGVLRREGEELSWYPTTAWGGPIGTTWDGLIDVTPLRIKLRSWMRRRRERRH